MHQVFCFGASTVYGVGASKGSWSDKIKSQTLLAQYNTEADAAGEKIEVYNLGIPGEKSDQLLKRLEYEIKARRAFHSNAERIAIISCGTNDSKAIGSSTDYVMSAEEFTALSREIISTAKKLVTHVIGLGITPVDDSKTAPMANGDTYFANTRIMQFERIYQDVCKNSGMRFIPLFDSASEEGWQNGYLYRDGLHSNDDGHQWIFEKVWPELDRLIKL